MTANAETWTSPEGQPADRPIHIMPINDLRDHVTDILCPCMPKMLLPEPVVEDGVMLQPDHSHAVIRHNSYDGREIGETCRRALDLLGKALAVHSHEWSSEERDAYEHAITVLENKFPEPAK